MTPDRPAGLRFKLLHVGVAVPSLDPTAELLSTLFGFSTVSGPFEDPLQKVVVSFLAKASDLATEIELVAPASEDSPIRSILIKRGGGAYHLCLETNDLDAALAHVKDNGCVVVSPATPAVAFQGRRIAWIYTPTRQLFELVEAEPAT